MDIVDRTIKATLDQGAEVGVLELGGSGQRSRVTRVTEERNLPAQSVQTIACFALRLSTELCAFLGSVVLQRPESRRTCLLCSRESFSTHDALLPENPGDYGRVFICHAKQVLKKPAGRSLPTSRTHVFPPLPN